MEVDNCEMSWRRNNGDVYMKLYLGIVERVIRSDLKPIYRPSIGDVNGINPIISTMMELCWAEQPNSRPTFDEVAKLARKINNGKLVDFVIFLKLYCELVHCRSAP